MSIFIIQCLHHLHRGEKLAKTLSERLKGVDGGVRGVCWAHSPNEEMGLLKGLVDQLGGGTVVYRSPRAGDEIPLPGFPNLIRRRELAPNDRGAEIFGFERVGDENAEGGLEALGDHDGVLIVAGDPLADVGEGFGAKASVFIYLGAYESPAAKNAHFVLPITTFAEQEGSYTNTQGRVQRFWPALRAPGAARPGWFVLGAISAEFSGGELPLAADQAFAQVAEGTPMNGITYRDMGNRGAPVNHPAPISGD